MFSFMQNARRSVPLIIAAEEGHPETVEKLLKGGAKVNHQNNVRIAYYVPVPHIA